MTDITKKQKKNSREYAKRKMKQNHRYNKNIKDYKKLFKLKNNANYSLPSYKLVEKLRKEYGGK